MNIKDKLVIFFATGFYVGNIPFAPGTFGTALGLVFCYFLSLLDIWVAVGGIAVFIAFSVWIAHQAEKIVGQKDPGRIVIDEIAGTLIAVIGLAGWPWLVAVVVARLADIFKVLPGVGQAESLPGAVGITMDDVSSRPHGLAAGRVTVLRL